MKAENRGIASPMGGWDGDSDVAMHRGIPEYASYKVVFDIAVAVLTLAMFGLLILSLMVLVKLTSRGPALYTQVRLGRGGRTFTIYKLRTMTHNCERGTGPCWATANDARITPLGRILRRTHLDELPQLWNVIRGDMSLIGPRPERPEIASLLAIVVPGFEDRGLVRPGITGFAQIQLPADSDVGGVRRKLAYDLFYIREVNAWLDLRILAGTALKILGFRFGAIRRVLLLPGSDDVLGHENVGSAEHDRSTLPQLLEALA